MLERIDEGPIGAWHAQVALKISIVPDIFAVSRSRLVKDVPVRRARDGQIDAVWLDELEELSHITRVYFILCLS